MTREARNNLIYSIKNELSQKEFEAMIKISGLIGDDTMIDIDWDEFLDIDEDIESILNTMFDYSILETLDYEDNICG